MLGSDIVHDDELPHDKDSTERVFFVGGTYGQGEWSVKSQTDIKCYQG